MKISRKIIISVITYSLTTIVGFLGTIYFANVLGPGPIGTFALGMTIVKWLELTDFGTGGAMAKRISERKEEGEFLFASIIIRGALVLVPTLSILLFGTYVNNYIGGDYAGLVAMLFFTTSLYTFTGRILVGINKPHIKNTTDTIERVIRVVLQASLVVAGLGVLALYWGYLLSLILAAVIAGAIFLREGVRPAIPKRRHFVSIYDYAKFNWLTRLRNRSFSWIDILVLGYYVTNDAVGIYQVTWNIAMTFWLVSNAISSNLFPEISHLSAQDESERIRELLTDGLAYAGAIPLPGIIGTALVGRGVLQLYGPEFVVAADLLVVVAILAFFKSYEQQVLTALNSLDYPEYTFRVNFAFVASNIGLNILLIPEFELLGAAVATMISVIVSLIYSWYLLHSIVSIKFPLRELSYQLVAALGMGIGVLLIKQVVPFSGFRSTLSLVFIGVILYFGLLILLSRKFRSLTTSLLVTTR